MMNALSKYFFFIEISVLVFCCCLKIWYIAELLSLQSETLLSKTPLKKLAGKSYYIKRWDITSSKVTFLKKKNVRKKYKENCCRSLFLYSDYEYNYLTRVFLAFLTLLFWYGVTSLEEENFWKKKKSFLLFIRHSHRKNTTSYMVTIGLFLKVISAISIQFKSMKLIGVHFVHFFLDISNFSSTFAKHKLQALKVIPNVKIHHNYWNTKKISFIQNIDFTKY